MATEDELEVAERTLQ